jgi:hypothetical protein
VIIALGVLGTALQGIGAVGVMVVLLVLLIDNRVYRGRHR